MTCAVLWFYIPAARAWNSNFKSLRMKMLKLYHLLHNMYKFISMTAFCLFQAEPPLPQHKQQNVRYGRLSWSPLTFHNISFCNTIRFLSHWFNNDSTFLDYFSRSVDRLRRIHFLAPQGSLPQPRSGYFFFFQVKWVTKCIQRRREALLNRKKKKADDQSDGLYPQEPHNITCRETDYRSILVQASYGARSEGVQ